MATFTEPTFMNDLVPLKLYQKARALYANKDFNKALEIFDDLLSAHSEDRFSWFLHVEQGEIYMDLARNFRETDIAIVYLLGALGCLSEDVVLSGTCVRVLHRLAEYLGSVLYYKKCLHKGRQASSLRDPDGSNPFLKYGNKEELAKIIKHAEFMIAVSKTCSIQKCELKVWEPKKTPDPPEDRVKGLRSYWMGLDVKIKRDFMKVNIAKLKSFVKVVYKAKGRDALEELLAFARENGNWTIWSCRTTCLEKFSSAEECKTHLEQQHAADFKTSSEKDIVRRIGKNWVHKISVGDWEPVNVVAAVEMIKNQLAYVKVFTSKSKKKGWSSEWPLAADQERNDLLKEIKLLLVSLCDHEILSCSIRDWVMRFPAKYLGELEVSEQSLIASRLVETPQSICFLERHDLIKIRDFLKTIKCERNDGTDMVFRAVDSLLDRTRIIENIDFDAHFSLLLLDKRLLKSNNAPYDDDVKINLIDDPNAHYAKAQAQGDNIISWLVDYSSVDKSFPRPIREHNLDIWVAVLRAVQYTCRDLGTKYAKKKQVLDYEVGLTAVENLCMSEVERRRNVQKDQWESYASLLCNRCEESIPGNFLTSKSFLCAVRDVFGGAWDPTFDFTDLDDCLNLIREGKSLSDDIVLMSIGLVKSMVTEKVLLIDSKILLIDTSRIRLLNNLIRLSIFDNRSYMLQLLKPFLLNEIVNMEAKAKSDAEADLLLQKEKKSPLEEKKSQEKKKKKIKSIKITSTSMSSPLDKTVELKSSVNLEPEATSPSLKTMEEDPMKPEDTLASEKVPSDIASKTDIQEEATKVNPGDMQNITGEDSLSGHLESALRGAAARYNSALDMTLKALMNINVLKEDLKHNKQPFHDDLEEHVPDALQNLFTAVVSGVITEGGVYSDILRDLLALLEEVNSMACDAAEVLVIILEFWHCWKNAERESLVTRLFTLEENERMTCRKCRKKPNYPEQNSYGIVIAADSIRDLKCTFGNIKFVEILKVIRTEYKMLCDIKTGGCGKTNFVHHIITKCPPIFTIVLEWEKSETEKAISETAKALEWEIDISRLYEGLEPNNNYRLVSLVGYGEEGEHICIAYEKNRWVNLRRESLAGEVVGNWKSVVRFCGGRKVRPVILLYEAARSMMA